MNCKNCNYEVNLNYCPNCGHAVTLKRIDAHYIQHEVEHVLHFEKGILYTVKELLIRPGENVRRFISENRSRLVKPIIFIIISSLIFTVVSHFFHLEDRYLFFDGDIDSPTGAIFNWIQNHYGYANIIIGVFISSWLKLFFRKHTYNFFETLILMCFVMGMSMLLFSLMSIIEGITKLKMGPISGILAFVYCSWAIGQFYDGRKVGNYLKALSAYILGMLTFSILALCLGMAIEEIVKL